MTNKKLSTTYKESYNWQDKNTQPAGKRAEVMNRYITEEQILMGHEHTWTYPTSLLVRGV